MWVSRACRLVATAILAQTLFFKFSGAAESVYIFETVGQEPWGRYGSGVVELAACVLFWLPAWIPVGAVLALGVMSGAIFFHLTKLGVEVQGDGGLLFALALFTWASSAVVLWLLGQASVFGPARRGAAVPPAVATRSA